MIKFMKERIERLETLSSIMFMGFRISAQRADCCRGNSVGKAIKGVEIVVVDENGKIQPESAKGMLLIRKGIFCLRK